jgi:hypothetical protein
VTEPVSLPLSRYDFNNYLSGEDLEEVVERVRNILADGRRFTVVHQLAAVSVPFPDVYTNQTLRSDGPGVESGHHLGYWYFTVFPTPGLESWGGSTRFALRREAREHGPKPDSVRVQIDGGARPGEIGNNDRIAVERVNEHGVGSYWVIKPNRHSSQEAAAEQAALLERLAAKAPPRARGADAGRWLREQAATVRDTWRLV